MIAELSGVVALAVALLMSVAVALLAFMVLVQPIWCIIDCAIDRKRSAGGKAVWIVILIVLWGVANWFYGALAAAGVALRTVTRAAWVLVIVLVGVFLFMFYGDAEFRGGIEREWQRRGPLITAGADSGPLAKRKGPPAKAAPRSNEGAYFRRVALIVPPLPRPSVSGKLT